MTACVRRHIHIPALDPAPHEPTSTLVLTHPSGTFVDVRFLLPASGAPYTPLPLGLPRIQGYAHPPSSALAPRPTADELPVQLLDWAFAGHAVQTPRADSALVDCTWHHTVDSRTPDAAGVRDAGVCEQVCEFAPRRRERTSRGRDPTPRYWDRETGTMRVPGHEGRGELAYEEGWVHVPVVLDSAVRMDEAYTGRPAVHLLMPPYGPRDGAREASVVLSRDDGHARGVVLRLGSWVQGVVRVRVQDEEGGEDVAAQRWGMWPGRGWTLLGRAGPDDELREACAAAMREGLALGEELAGGWTVTTAGDQEQGQGRGE